MKLMKIGAAPRRPTHEANADSRQLKRKGNRQANVASGRATTISTRAMTIPVGIEGSRSCGVTSSPSMRNSTICASHPTPSKKLAIACSPG
jgi:hypothetical protein